MCVKAKRSKEENSTEPKLKSNDMIEIKNGEHRENISPEIDVHKEAVSKVNQSPDISLNPKTLRRSLRQKGETDGTVDSQDKKDNQQKKEKQKDNEKILPRKITQNRETPGQKEKAKTLEKASDASGSVDVNSATGNIDARENSQEKSNMNLEKSEHSLSSDFEESGHDAPVEKLEVFPHYHTRRAASQGLLTNLEKSETDSSEIREEGAKRKWFGKLRKYDSSGNEAKEEPESQEFCSQAAVEIQTRQEPSTLDTRSVVPNNPSGVSEDDASATAVTAFTSPKTFLDMSKCQHKRSKRARKSRSCECCDEKLTPQEKSNTLDSPPKCKELDFLSFAKLKTTPTKESLSPGTHSHKYKNSKMIEMVTEPTTASTESVYPALVGCKASIDIILPQITPNTCHLQVKSRGMEQNTAERSINVMDETLFSANENAVIADVCETEVSSTEESSAIDLWTLVNLLFNQTSPESLRNYSGNQLVEMQQKLQRVSNYMINSLKSRYELL
ncbi:RIF1: Telomere-associated protein RIF1 [Crotalus adamanteus]|uniref:RIF1: Telomere-associated protein RIF1 n=1 Tax=Crotalus adamanteus TaxID=8729 RepID=A0AAW1C7Z9_CROAD